MDFFPTSAEIFSYLAEILTSHSDNLASVSQI